MSAKVISVVPWAVGGVKEGGERQEGEDPVSTQDFRVKGTGS